MSDKENDTKLDLKNAELVRYILSGALGGLTVGGGIGLANLLLNLQKKQEKLTDKYEDEELIIDLPEKFDDLDSLVDLKKESSDNTDDKEEFTALNKAIATILGLGTAMTGYYGIRSLLQKKRNKDNIEDLDSVQRAYFTDLLRANKSASTEQPMEKRAVLDTVFTLMLLAGLASGVGTYSFLNKTYPTLKDTSPDVLRPKRIRYRYPKEDKEKTEATNTDKEPDETDKTPEFSNESSERVVSASYNREYLLRNIIGNTKQAEDSGLSNLVNAIALGHIDELMLSDIDSIIEKSACYTERASKEKQDLAISYLSTSEFFGTALEPLLVAESLETTPVFAKAAEFLSPDDIETITHFTVGMINDCRAEALHNYTGLELTTKFNKKASIIETPQDYILADLYKELITTNNY